MAVGVHRQAAEAAVGPALGHQVEGEAAEAPAWGSVKQKRAVAGFSSSSASSSSTTTMRRSGSSYFTPIEPTSQANGSGVTAPWPSAGLDVGGQVVEQRQQVLAERRHLLLLAPQVDEPALVAAGEEEHPLPGGPSAPGQNTSARGKSYDSPMVTTAPAHPTQRCR